MKRFYTATALMTMALLFGSAAMAVEPAQKSGKEIKEMAASASTPAEHRAVAAWFGKEAGRLEAKAVKHEDLADIYTNHPAILGSKPSVPISGSATHCNNISKSLRAAANEDRALAAEHEQMAAAAER